MTRSEIIRSLQEDYARLREENLREHERRLVEAGQKDPRIAEIAEESRALFMRQARNLLMRPDDAEKMAAETRKKAALLRGDQEKRLSAAGLPTDYLDPVYRCKACRDTGYVGEGVRSMCACMEKRLIDRLYDSARERGTADQRFENFNESIFPDDVLVDGVNTQRRIALRARRMCKEYAETYPETDTLNVLLTGETGLGKTFLLLCIENRLLDRGFSPICVTAYRLFETMRGTHFSDAERKQEFDQLVECDILLIDDLGTEPIMQNITREYLFTLLNERLTQQRHTVIATNLNVLELKELYGERVFSRLFDTVNVTPAQLKGKDLRMMSGRGGK